MKDKADKTYSSW